MQIKYQNKLRLAEYIQKHNGVEVDPVLFSMYRLRDCMSTRDSY